MAKEADRATTRFLTPFVIDFIVAGAKLQGRYDLGLLFLLVALANVEHIARDEALDWAYSTESLPDHLRRPISGNAIAQELNLPHETVRRQLNILEQRGALVRVDRRGLIVPREYSMRPEVSEALNTILFSFLKAANDLMAAGFVWPTDKISTIRRLRPAPAGQATPTFLVWRHMLALGVRLVEWGLPIHGTLEHMLLVYATVEHNTRGWTYDPVIARRYASSRSEPPPDNVREPAPVALLCERTGLPRSTVNRMVREQVASRMMQRVGGGVVVPTRVFESPRARDGMVVTHSFFIATASRLAVLSLTGDELRRWYREASGEGQGVISTLEPVRLAAAAGC